MSEELKPCPFCASSKVEAGGDDKVVGVWCHNCGAAGPNGYLTINGDFEWNTRAPAQVKPLEWENFDAWTWWAKTPFSIYRVNERDGRWTCTIAARGYTIRHPLDAEHGNTEEAAKASAQDHYERRIREALL